MNDDEPGLEMRDERGLEMFSFSHDPGHCRDSDGPHMDDRNCRVKE